MENITEKYREENKRIRNIPNECSNEVCLVIEQRVSRVMCPCRIAAQDEVDILLATLREELEKRIGRMKNTGEMKEMDGVRYTDGFESAVKDFGTILSSVFGEKEK